MHVLMTFLLFAGTLAASPITYTIVGTATGTVGSTPFTNAMLTITLVTDTGLISHPGVFYNTPADPR